MNSPSNDVKNLAKYLADWFEEFYDREYDYDFEDGKEYTTIVPKTDKLAEYIQQFYNNKL